MKIKDNVRLALFYYYYYFVIVLFGVSIVLLEGATEVPLWWVELLEPPLILLCTCEMSRWDMLRGRGKGRKRESFSFSSCVSARVGASWWDILWVGVRGGRKHLSSSHILICTKFYCSCFCSDSLRFKLQFARSSWVSNDSSKTSKLLVEARFVVVAVGTLETR